jgi:hypothetical protein
MFLPDILNRWLYAEQVTVPDLANWAEMPVSTMYKVTAGERDLRFDEAQRLSRAACLYKDLTDLADAMCSSKFEVRAKGDGATINHCIDDEVADLVVSTGTLRSAYRSGDRTAVERAIREQEAVIERMKAEGRALTA